MTDVKPPTRRHFTEAARAAAQEARRLKHLNPPDKLRAEVFVVRLPPTDRLFGWEIRRFGSVLLGRSSETFSTIEAARQAGLRALAGQH